MVCANDPETLQRVAAGDVQSLLYAVACEACLWLRLDGFDHRLGWVPSPAHVVDHGRAAAALNLLQLLDRSPQGREALGELGVQLGQRAKVLP